MSLLDCNIVESRRNLGESLCNKMPGLIRGMITTPLNFKFTAEQLESASAVETALQNAILAGISQRVYLWPNFSSFENISEEAVYEDTPLAYLPVRDGNYRFRFGIRENMCLHRAMFTHRASSGRVFLIDNENQLLGTIDSEGNFMGFTIQMLHTEKLIFSDGTVSTKSPIVLALSNNKEIDESGGIIPAAFVNTVERLTDVVITVVSQDTSELVVDVKVECDSTPVNGLLLADFVLLDSEGSAQTISTATESDGRYTLTTSSPLETGTIDLRSPATLTVQAYENIAPVAVTVGS